MQKKRKEGKRKEMKRKEKKIKKRKEKEKEKRKGLSSVSMYYFRASLYYRLLTFHIVPIIPSNIKSVICSVGLTDMT